MKICRDWFYLFLIIMFSALYVLGKATFETSVIYLLTAIGCQNFVNSIEYWEEKK